MDDMVKIILSMILLTASAFCMVYAPKIAGQTADLLIANWNSTNDPAIYVNLGVLVILYSGGYLLNLPPKRIMGATGEKVAYGLRMKLFDKLDAVGSVSLMIIQRV